MRYKKDYFVIRMLYVTDNRQPVSTTANNVEYINRVVGCDFLYLE